MLFTWVGRYGALLVSSQVATRSAYLVIVVLSVGLLVQVSMIVLALRKVGDLVGWRVTGDERQGALRVIESALLPFLGIYVSFGYISDYVSNLLFLIQEQSDFSTLAMFLSTMNPTQSTTRLWIVLGVLVLLYVVGHLLNWAREKTSASWLSLVSAVVTAGGTFLGLLSVFRIWEQVSLWFQGRKIAGAKDIVLGWMSDLFHIDFPEILAEAWGFFTDTIWPAFWTLLVHPLVWFALAMVVAGSRFIQVESLVDKVVHPPRSKVANFVRLDIQDRVLGDLDVKVFPILHALRRMWKATLPFIGAYILVFTGLTWLGESLEALAWRWIGMRTSDQMMVAVPLVDLILAVLIMSLKLALLVVAVRRADELAAVSEDENHTSLLNGVIIVGLCFVMAVLNVVTAPGSVTVSAAQVGSSVTLMGAQVVATDAEVATSVTSGAAENLTDLRFVVVHVTAYSPYDTVILSATLTAGGHTYGTYDDDELLTTTPGFLSERDYIFEVGVADLAGPVSLEVRPRTSLTAQVEVARFHLTPDITGSGGRAIEATSRTTMRVP